MILLLEDSLTIGDWKCWYLTSFRGPHLRFFWYTSLDG